MVIVVTQWLMGLLIENGTGRNLLDICLLVFKEDKRVRQRFTDASLSYWQTEVIHARSSLCGYFHHLYGSLRTLTSNQVSVGGDRKRSDVCSEPHFLSRTASCAETQ